MPGEGLAGVNVTWDSGVGVCMASWRWSGRLREPMCGEGGGGVVANGEGWGCVVGKGGGNQVSSTCMGVVRERLSCLSACLCVWEEEKVSTPATACHASTPYNMCCLLGSRTSNQQAARPKCHIRNGIVGARNWKNAHARRSVHATGSETRPSRE